MKKIIFILPLFWGHCSTGNLPAIKTVANDLDSLPISLSAMKSVHPPSCKLFKGAVDGKTVRLLVKKSGGNNDLALYKGFFYEADSIVVAVVGNEEIYQGFQSVNGSNIRREMEGKLNPNCSFSYALLNGLNGFVGSMKEYPRFYGWFKEHQYIYMNPKQPDEVLFPSDTHRLRPYLLTHPYHILEEVKIPYEYVKVLTTSEELLSEGVIKPLKFETTMALPTDTLLRQKILQRLYPESPQQALREKAHQHIHRVLQDTTRPIRRLRRFMVKDNGMDLNASLNLSYLDDKIVSFVYECEDTWETFGLTYHFPSQQFIEKKTLFKNLKKLEQVLLTSADLQTLLKDDYRGDGFNSTITHNFFLTNKGVVFQFPPTNFILNYTYIFLTYAALESCLTDSFKATIQNW